VGVLQRVPVISPTNEEVSPEGLHSIRLLDQSRDFLKERDPVISAKVVSIDPLLESGAWPPRWSPPRSPFRCALLTALVSREPPTLDDLPATWTRSRAAVGCPGLADRRLISPPRRRSLATAVSLAVAPLPPPGLGRGLSLALTGRSAPAPSPGPPSNQEVGDAGGYDGHDVSRSCRSPSSGRWRCRCGGTRRLPDRGGLVGCLVRWGASVGRVVVGPRGGSGPGLASMRRDRVCQTEQGRCPAHRSIPLSGLTTWGRSRAEPALAHNRTGCITGGSFHVVPFGQSACVLIHTVQNSLPAATSWAVGAPTLPSGSALGGRSGCLGWTSLAVGGQRAEHRQPAVVQSDSLDRTSWGRRALSWHATPHSVQEPVVPLTSALSHSNRHASSALGAVRLPGLNLVALSVTWAPRPLSPGRQTPRDWYCLGPADGHRGGPPSSPSSPSFFRKSFHVASQSVRDSRTSS